MAMDYSKILSQCKDRLFFYSHYKFIRDYDRDKIFVETILSPLMDKINRGEISVQQIVVNKEPHHVLIEQLPWDTKYFGFPVYKILTVLYTHDNYSILKKAMLQLTSKIINEIGSFYFLEIPSEDEYLIQALCECRFKLTETRLHYVYSIADYYCNERYQVREATEDDIKNLKKISVQMRNPYDRLHADISFRQKIADTYVSTYIENSVKGFADLVLVPSEGNGPADAFITCFLSADKILDQKVAKIGLVAVSNRTRKGWMRKLLSEMIYTVKNRGYDYILADTQASNMPANKVFASSGFKYAFATHIFSNFIEPDSR